MKADGSIHPEIVAQQARRLVRDGLAGAFICGSTGESHSLTVSERMRIAEAWRTALQPGEMKLIVHAGHNSIFDAKALAAHAAGIQADAISIMAPCYYRPSTVDDLVEFCAQVAAAAPSLPFYFYDIPALTGVHLSMVEFLRRGSARIPNLAGLKFTTSDFMSLQQCLQLEDGRFNILFGVDEMLLASLALGVPGAVGSTYNYCAPHYQKLIRAYQAGDMNTARQLQLKSVKTVEILCQYGVLAGGKALMSKLGIDCGPVRPPVRNLSEEQRQRLFAQIDSLGIIEQTPSETVVLA
jgi:N-acetylneuraminate lyase